MDPKSSAAVSRPIMKEYVVKDATVNNVNSSHVKKNVHFLLPQGLFRDTDAERGASRILAALTQAFSDSPQAGSDFDREMTIVGEKAVVKGSVTHTSVDDQLSIEVVPDEQLERRLSQLKPGESIISEVEVITGFDMILSTFQRPIENKRFIDRPSLTQKMKTYFDEKTQQQLTLAAAGLGGVGKTQLATDYFWASAARYRLRAWFYASTTEQLALQYVNLGRENGLKLPEHLTPMQKALRVKLWLERQPDVLLVYDNVPKADTIAALLPEKGDHHLLITSRNEVDWDADKILNVDVMSKDEAFALFVSEAGLEKKVDPANISLIKELVGDKVLGRLPLAITQAAVYVKRKKMSVKDYLSRYRSHRGALLQYDKLPAQSLSFDTEAKFEKQRPVWVTFDINLEDLASECPAALRAMYASSFLSYADIPEVIVKEATMLLVGEMDAPDLLWDEVTEALRLYSLMQIDAENKRMSIHPLLQEIMRGKVAEVDKSKVLQSLTELFSNRFIYDARDARAHVKVLADYVPHVLRLFEHLLESISSLALVKLLSIVATYYSRELCDYVASLDYFKRALEKLAFIAKKLDKQDWLKEYSRVFFEIGHVYFSMGFYHCAREFYEGAFNVIDRYLPADLSTVGRLNKAVGFHQLANVIERSNPQRDRSAINEASDYYLQSFQINFSVLKEVIKQGAFQKGLPNPEHVVLVAIADNLHEFSHLLSITDDHELALLLIKKAIELKKIFYGDDDHPNMAISLRKWGTLLARAGRYGEAQEKYAQSLVMYEAAYGTKEHDEYRGVFGRMQSLRMMLSRGAKPAYLNIVDYTLDNWRAVREVFDELCSLKVNRLDDRSLVAQHINFGVSSPGCSRGDVSIDPILLGQVVRATGVMVRGGPIHIAENYYSNSLAALAAELDRGTNLSATASAEPDERGDEIEKARAPGFKALRAHLQHVLDGFNLDQPQLPQAPVMGSPVTQHSSMSVDESEGTAAAAPGPAKKATK